MNRLAPVLILLLLLPALVSPNTAAVPIIESDIPVHAAAGVPVNVFVNITSELPIPDKGVLITYINPAYGNLNNDYMELVSGNNTNGTWYFAIPPQAYRGTLDVWIIVSDVSGASLRVPAAGSVTVDIDGPEPLRPFPWNLVVIIGFMAVVLIATELIFKPGFYRKTGRQRARELEEEDRKRETENGFGP